MKLRDKIKHTVARIFNRLSKKDAKSILFYPHTNCKLDGYDILNGDSDNALCLLNDILRDPSFNDFQLHVIYYHKDRLQSYIENCKPYNAERVHFIHFDNKKAFMKAVSHSYTIFTDTDYTRLHYRVKSQRVICLNYFGGLIKNEFHRWESHGGFKKMLKEQKDMHRLFDYHLSISDVTSKFIALDNCHYYPHFVSLGFPRNDVLFQDHSILRKQIEELVGFKVNKIITYVPTHRDYENSNREFFDKNSSKMRSIWGQVSGEELLALERALAETDTLIIAKVHPIQQSEGSNISSEASKHILFYSELAKHIRTSLNPILAVSDSIITDYTTTVFDYLYLDRPIIYYFYDIEKYRETRGFFIEPIESMCAGHFTYSMDNLINAVKDIAEGIDPQKEKRAFLQELFIKDVDGNSSRRIKDFFFPKSSRS